MQTDKTEYNGTDTIIVSLSNNSMIDIPIWLHCYRYLKMYYQKKEGRVWADNQSFGFMNTRCLDAKYTLSANSTFKQLLVPDDFGSPGVYRLWTTVIIPKTNDIDTIVSNEFRIN